MKTDMCCGESRSFYETGSGSRGNDRPCKIDTLERKKVRGDETKGFGSTGCRGYAGMDA